MKYATTQLIVLCCLLPLEICSCGEVSEQSIIAEYVSRYCNINNISDCIILLLDEGVIDDELKLYNNICANFKIKLVTIHSHELYSELNPVQKYNSIIVRNNKMDLMFNSDMILSESENTKLNLIKKITSIDDTRAIYNTMDFHMLLDVVTARIANIDNAHNSVNQVYIMNNIVGKGMWEKIADDVRKTNLYDKTIILLTDDYSNNDIQHIKHNFMLYVKFEEIPAEIEYEIKKVKYSNYNIFPNIRIKINEIGGAEYAYLQ